MHFDISLGNALPNLERKSINCRAVVIARSDNPDLMRSSNKTRMIWSNSSAWPTRLLPCSGVAIVVSWVLISLMLVLSYSQVYTLLQPDNALGCEGKWVHVYNLSEDFNRQFLRQCATFKKGRDLCMYMQNGGMGPPFRFGPERGGPEENDGDAAAGPWYNTWQFALELYFHERLMRQYPCLTDREDDANAFFVPFYAGMDLSSRFTHQLAKDELFLELAAWLQARTSWQRRQGRDHFMMLGRIASDFRQSGGDGSWGNQMLQQKAFREMVVLSIERSSGSASVEKEIAVPYPTYFHAPSSSGELRHLLDWIRQTSQRVSLVSMAAGKRHPTANKMRHRLMAQCGDDPRCTLLLCVGHEASPGLATEIANVSALPVKMEGETAEVRCNNPAVLLRAMHQSVFCVQPPGDSPTRRSFFDALLVGCIPVIFCKHAAWSQYVHHLPEHGASYSVLIPMAVASKSNVIDILSEVAQSKINEMQANIAKLVPRILYSGLSEVGQEVTTPSTPDAFDIAMETVLESIQHEI